MVGVAGFEPATPSFPTEHVEIVLLQCFPHHQAAFERRAPEWKLQSSQSLIWYSWVETRTTDLLTHSQPARCWKCAVTRCRSCFPDLNASISLS